MKGAILFIVLVCIALVLSFHFLCHVYRGMMRELTSLFNKSMEKVPYPDIVEHSMNFCKGLMQIVFLVLSLLLALLFLMIVCLFAFLIVKNL